MTKNTESPRSFGRFAAALVVLITILVGGLEGPAAANAAKAQPTLSNQASNGWWAGVPIFHSGNLGGGVNPTGFIIFALFGPDDSTCSRAPIFSSYIAVSGNGYYKSASYTTNAAGTYRWVSRYSGDANNNPTAPTPCGTPSATTIAAKRNPTLSGSASQPWGLGAVTNWATLGNGVGPNGPTGTITWTLYASTDLFCTALPLFTTVRTVSGNGSYNSGTLVLPLAGKFSWKLTYSGDANNARQSTTCSDPANQVTYGGAAAAATTLTAAPSALAPGDPLTITWSGVPSPTSGDYVAIYPVGGSRMIAWRYTGGTATGSATVTVPPTAAPGNYEVRLRTTKSGVVTVR